MTDQPKKPREVGADITIHASFTDRERDEFVGLLKLLGLPLDNPAKALKLVRDMFAKVTEERDELAAELKHWKANHDNQVQIKANLSDNYGKLLAANKAMAEALATAASKSSHMVDVRCDAREALAHNEKLMKEIGE